MTLPRQLDMSDSEIVYNLTIVSGWSNQCFYERNDKAYQYWLKEVKRLQNMLIDRLNIMDLFNDRNIVISGDRESVYAAIEPLPTIKGETLRDCLEQALDMIDKGRTLENNHLWGITLKENENG